MELDHRPVEKRYFAKNPGKEYRQFLKNVGWSHFRTDIGKMMKGWDILRRLSRNQLDEEVDKWSSNVSEVVGKHSNTVLVVRGTRSSVSCTRRNSGKSTSPFHVGKQRLVGAQRTGTGSWTRGGST